MEGVKNGKQVLGRAVKNSELILAHCHVNYQSAGLSPIFR